MYFLRVVTEEVDSGLNILKRYSELKKRIEQGHTCIKDMKIIKENGEIIHEYKRL